MYQPQTKNQSVLPSAQRRSANAPDNKRSLILMPKPLPLRSTLWHHEAKPTGYHIFMTLFVNLYVRRAEFSTKLCNQHVPPLPDVSQNKAFPAPLKQPQLIGHGRLSLPNLCRPRPVATTDYPTLISRTQLDTPPCHMAIQPSHASTPSFLSLSVPRSLSLRGRKTSFRH